MPERSSQPSSVTIILFYDKEREWYTAWVSNVPAVGEGATQRQAITTLKESLRRCVEIFGVVDTRTRMKHSPFKVRKLKWNLSDLSSRRDGLG